MNHSHHLIPLALIAISPNLLQAQTATDIVFNIRNGLGIFVTVGIGLAMVFFIAGMISFLSAAGDQSAHEKGRQRMVWGLIALFFMVSIWGIVGIIQRIFYTMPGGACQSTSINVGNANTSGYLQECM